MVQPLSRRVLLVGLAALPWLGRAAVAAPAPVTVYKDPSCGCCGGWVEHLRQAGFSVTVVEDADLSEVKTRLGVPDDLLSCHTAEVGGYVIEGHVPAPAILRLLAERPQATGLAVPGMPPGSPGMGGEPVPFEVMLFGPTGQTVYGRFRGGEPL